MTVNPCDTCALCVKSYGHKDNQEWDEYPYNNCLASFPVVQMNNKVEDGCSDVRDTFYNCPLYKEGRTGHYYNASIRDDEGKTKRSVEVTADTNDEYVKAFADSFVRNQEYGSYMTRIFNKTKFYDNVKSIIENLDISNKKEILTKLEVFMEEEEDRNALKEIQEKASYVEGPSSFALALLEAQKKKNNS